MASDHISRALARLKQDDARGALDELARAPEGVLTAQGHYLAATAHYRLKEAGAAEASARTSISLDPGYAPSHYYLGLALADQGRGEEAVRAFQTVMRLDPGMTQAANELTKLGASAPPSAVGAAAGRPRDDNLMWLPKTEEEWADYRGRRIKQAKIEAEAEGKAWWSGIPGWGKVILLGVAAWIVWGIFQSQDDSGMKDFERQRDEIQQQTCEQFGDSPNPPPGCD